MASGAGRDHVQVDTEAYDYRWPILVGCPQHYALLEELSRCCRPRSAVYSGGRV
jgi:hypothetical protein